PKLGTVTFNIKEAVEKMKAGQVELKTDKFGVVRTVIGKADFECGSLKEILAAVFKTLVKVNPAHIGTKTSYIKTLVIHPTHGPAVAIDVNDAWVQLIG
ncbi:MAG TPA: 50S ribosomal protein L1, partial [bacterium]|nr:50S ribosomal protein L1 [bacterium]